MTFVYSFVISLLLIIFVESKNTNADCACSLFSNCTLNGVCIISLSLNVNINNNILIKSDTETYELTLSGNYNITISSSTTLTFSNLKV
jgi:hypothetical protein